METLIRRMVACLDEYDPKTLSIDPVESRDLLKKLYQLLFPKTVRHDLGEYYTCLLYTSDAHFTLEVHSRVLGIKRG
jgi:hypothetical protein